MFSRHLRPLQRVARNAAQKLTGLPNAAAGRLSALKIGCIRLYKVAKPFWVAPDSRLHAWSLLAIIIVLMWANARINVLISDATNDFITSIARKDPLQARNHALMYCALLVVAVTPIAVYYGYCRSRLALLWRQWLANDFFASYFVNLAYYKLTGNRELDNPDQRMTQDVDSFCNSSVGLFMSLVDASVQIYMWSGVLWGISHSLTWTVIAYALGGTVVVMTIGRALIGLTNTQMRSEGDLRFTLQEVVRESGTIAFTRGEPVARRQSSMKLQIVIETLLSILRKNRNISLFTTLFNGMVPFIAPWYIGALWVAGSVDRFGTITQAGMAVVALMGAMTMFMSQFPGIASFLAIVFRLGSLKEGIEACGLDPLPPEKRIEIHQGQDLVFDGVTVLAADLNRKLVADLSFALKRGESVVILGEEGTGKTELLQVVAGMHNAGHGSLQRPPFAEVLFINEKPYLPPSTLREAMCYPKACACASDEQLLRALRFVELSELPARTGGLDCEQRWKELLTLSEQQRLSLARLFISNPQYAVLDDATSAVDKSVEKVVFSALAGAGTTVVSAARNDKIVQYHNWVIVLAADGTYSIHRSGDYHPSAAA